MFEMLLVVCALGSVVTWARAAVVAARKGLGSGLRILAVWIGLASLYVALVGVVALASPQRVFRRGESRCFDDWCVAVQGVVPAPELGPAERPVRPSNRFLVVTLRLSNRGHGPQRAGSAAVRILDAEGRRWEPSKAGQRAWEDAHGRTAPLTERIPGGGSYTTTRVFDVPVSARGLGLAVEHPVGFSPALFVLGDDDSILHKPTVLLLEGLETRSGPGGDPAR